MVGSNIKPFAIPNVIIPNHILKNSPRMYDFAGASTIIAMNVENPP